MTAVENLTAAEVTYSSVVGKSVMFTAPGGAVVAQIAIMVPSVAHDYRETAEAVAARIVAAWNRRATVSAGEMRALAPVLIEKMRGIPILLRDGGEIDGDELARILSALQPGDGWQGMRPMSDAPKGRARTPILARIRADLADTDPHYGMSNAAAYAGRFVVISHPGVAEDGFDIGWSLHGPFGHGLGSDSFFEGWWPLPASLTGEETR